MSSALTVSTDTIAANTFGAVDPQPFAEQKARVVAPSDNQLTGFLANEDKVNISNQAKTLAQQQIQENQNTANQANKSEETKEDEQPSDEFIQVSSSLGRAASTGNLKRDEAMAIYQKIASLI